MRAFGLTPDQILARSSAAEIKPPDTLKASIVHGAASFGAVSVLAYSIWAFRLIEGQAAMYSSVAAIYLGLTGLALSKLVLGPGAARRFAALFATAFLGYALAWCAFWFGMNGKYDADLWGAAAGLTFMTWLLRRAFAHEGAFLPLFAVLFLFHSLGYYLGDALYAIVRGSTGRILWGAAHGIGFGAGMGYLLFHCQAPLKARLATL